MTNHELPTPLEDDQYTERLIGKIRELLYEYSEYGSELNTEPGVVCRAGFLDHDPKNQYLTSSIVIITEWVNTGLPNCPSSYQIDQRSHLIGTDRTNIVDYYTSDEDAEGLLKYLLSDLNREQFEAYNNPDYAWVIKSLFDREGHRADIAVKEAGYKRMAWFKKRAIRKNLEQKYIAQGISAKNARTLARFSMSNAHSFRLGSQI